MFLEIETFLSYETTPSLSGFGVSSSLGEKATTRFNDAMRKRRQSATSIGNGKTYPEGGRKARRKMFRSASLQEGVSSSPSENTLSPVALARHVAALANNAKKVTLVDVQQYCDLRGISVKEIASVMWPDMWGPPPSIPGNTTEARSHPRRSSLDIAKKVPKGATLAPLGPRVLRRSNSEANIQELKQGRKSIVSFASLQRGGDGGSASSASSSGSIGTNSQDGGVAPWDSLEAQDKDGSGGYRPPRPGNLGVRRGGGRMVKSRSMSQISDLKQVDENDESMSFSPTGFPYLRRKSKLESFTFKEEPVRRASSYYHSNPDKGMRNTNISGGEKLIRS